jgi:hypothetical protein
MVRKSRKKNIKIQYGKGYPDELKRFITASAIEIGSDTDFVQFSPDCNLLNDEHCFNFNNIIIENTFDVIHEEYVNNRYLYLRPYRGEKIFVIACGNNRLDCSNYTNLNLEDCDLLDYNILHNHREAYTLDKDLVANPSIVANFNNDLYLEKIPDNSFNFIIFEGGGDPNHNPAEIQRLLNKNSLSMCIGMEEGDYYVYSCWDRGEYRIM